MRRWLRREAAPEQDDAPTEPLAVMGIEGIVEGRTPATERRTSDCLNAGEALPLQTVADDGTPGTWVDLNPDDIVAVVPAPRERSAGRLSRRMHPVDIQAGPYLFHGTAHLPIGADPGRYVASTSRWWLPLTACVVSSGEDRWSADVVIVNLDHASRTQATPT